MRHLVALGMGVAVALSAAGCARITTKVVEKPRVDQELGGQGNRGYLLGSAPAAGPRKTTRKMIETDIELPTKEELNPWRKPTSQAQPAAGQAQVAQAPVAQAPATELGHPPAGGWAMEVPGARQGERPTEPGHPPAGGWATEVPGARQGERPLPPVRPLPPTETWESPGTGWEAETTYTVQKGDTLQKIASKFYGSSRPWQKIYEANRASLESPDQIYAGQRIVIPPAEEIEESASGGDWK